MVCTTSAQSSLSEDRIRIRENSETRGGIDSLLPATYRDQAGNLRPPDSQDLTSFLSRELCVPRLSRIHSLLWMCGWPMPPRPLHHQRVLSRSITVSENVELHLVWYKGCIFIKPLPPYLLEPEFWQLYLSSKSETGEIVFSSRSDDNDLALCARGFLLSYTALVAYESDFAIAKRFGLLPTTMTWPVWRTFCREFLEQTSYDAIDPRYWYGELRLGRLNMVYALTQGQFLRGYSTVGSYTTYNEFLLDNITTMAAIFGYIIIVLTAMQVGLASADLSSNDTFQHVSYGFTVFSIVAPLAMVGVILCIAFVIFVSNWRATKRHKQSRFQNMGVNQI